MRVPSLPGNRLTSVFLALALLVTAMHLLWETDRGLQVLLLAALVALLGLPHGALDPLVARRAGIWTRPAGLLGFLGLYLLLFAACLLLWKIQPGLALAAFLGYSAWHFAGDWEGRLGPLERGAGGLLVIGGPSLRWGAEVEQIFALLAGVEAAAWLVSILFWLGLIALGGVVLVIWRRFADESAAALELGALAATVLLLPPLVFFVLYFCALHSPRHLFEASREADPRRAFAVGLLFTILALAAAVAVFHLFEAADHDTALMRTVFIGLAALTVPHMVLVDHRATWGRIRLGLFKALPGGPRAGLRRGPRG